MKRSADRILTTHTGSLPRPAELLNVFSGERRVDDPEVSGRVRDAVTDIVQRQVDAGIAVVGDGEMGKDSFATYMRHRLSGFSGRGEGVIQLTDLMDYPGLFSQWSQNQSAAVAEGMQPPACVGKIAVTDRQSLRLDIANLRAATRRLAPEEVFMTAASPGVIAAYCANHYYPSSEEYLAAIATAMREEYEAIIEAGFLLQLDCPDLAMCRHLQFQHLSLAEFRRVARLHIEVLNEATANIDPDRMRLHVCWGNYPGPHHHDVPLADIIDVVLDARPNGLLLEAANPRHAHEWEVFDEVVLPEGKVLVPGVIDSTINYVEHPDLVAQRLVRYASSVGAENVQAGADCGSSSIAGSSSVDGQVAWAKLQAMTEGARRASQRLARR